MEYYLLFGRCIRSYPKHILKFCDESHFNTKGSHFGNASNRSPAPSRAVSQGGSTDNGFNSFLNWILQCNFGNNPLPFQLFR